MRTNPYPPIAKLRWRGRTNLAGESAWMGWERGYADGLLQRSPTVGTGHGEGYATGHADGVHDSEAYMAALAEIESWGEDVADLVPVHRHQSIEWW